MLAAVRYLHIWFVPPNFRHPLSFSVADQSRGGSMTTTDFLHLNRAAQQQNFPPRAVMSDENGWRVDMKCKATKVLN